MKKSVILIIILFSFSFVSATNCAVRTYCLANEINVLDVSSASNAHVSSNNINYMQLCCLNSLISSGSVTQTCSPTSQTTPLRMYAMDNTHIEVPPENNYIYNLCLDNSLTCQVSQLPCSNLGANYFCLLKFKENAGMTNTNAHVSDCTDTFYSKSICCGVTAPVCGIWQQQCNTQSCCPNQNLWCSTGYDLVLGEDKGCCYGNQEWKYNDIDGWHCEETGSCFPDWIPENQGSFNEQGQACCDGSWRTVYPIN